jgi:hypothetical protein
LIWTQFCGCGRIASHTYISSHFPSVYVGLVYGKSDSHEVVDIFSCKIQIFPVKHIQIIVKTHSRPWICRSLQSSLKSPLNYENYLFLINFILINSYIFTLSCTLMLGCFMFYWIYKKYIFISCQTHRIYC